MTRKQPQRRTGMLLACATAALALTMSAGVHAYDRDKDKDDKSMQEQASDMMERAGDAASDMRMHLAIEAQFAQSDKLSMFSISTDVDDGVARLEGEVESEAERELAGELARSVEGVTGVVNRIEVKGDDPGFLDRLQAGASDAALTARVKTRLLTSENTSGLAIKVESEGDEVTLSGEVDSETERDLAELIAANTSGVSRVHNELRVNNY